MSESDNSSKQRMQSRAGRVVAWAGWATTAAAVCIGIADRIEAQEETLRLPPTESQAAGANGKPLLWWSDRADVGIPFNDELWKLHIGGHVDGSSTWNHKAQKGADMNGQRLFDTRADSAQLDQFDLFVARPVDPTWRTWDIGGKMEWMYGSDARFIHANGLYDAPVLVDNPLRTASGKRVRPFQIYDPETGGPENQIDLTQAYLNLTMPIGNGARVRVGKVASPVGIESIDPTISPFFSRGIIMTLALPYTVTGAWADYRLTDEWTAGVGVFRGWNQAWEDNNSADSFSATVQFIPRDQVLSFALNVLTGPEQPDRTSVAAVNLIDEPENSRDFRTTVDATIVYRLGGGAALGGEILWGREPHVLVAVRPDVHKTANWYAFAGYVTAPINKYLDVLVRGEYFDDNDFGLGYPGSWLMEFTGGLAIHPLPDNRYGRGLTIRPEIRWDQADIPIFPDGHNETQLTVGVELQYAF